MSPPVRGRGLKRIPAGDLDISFPSPPVRGRGLKRCRRAAPARPDTSPPVRGRGLKLRHRRYSSRDRRVAPRAGARIETRSHRPAGWDRPVAPRAGARIETGCARCPLQAVRASPPVRGRGLKRYLRLTLFQLVIVAPRGLSAGASVPSCPGPYAAPQRTLRRNPTVRRRGADA